MDITTAVLPAHDFQTSTDLDFTETDLLLQCFEDVDLSFFPLNEDHNALVLPSHNQQYDDPINSLNDNNHGDLVVYEEEDPLNDPCIWALCNGEDNDHAVDINNNNNLLESLCAVEESSGGNGINGDDNYEDEYAMYLVPQSRYNSCSLCHKLRQITHTNGSTSKAKRLEIHGIIGIITHVVVEKYDFDSCFQIRECKIFDFQRENAQVVKGFLCKYLKACEEEGYTSMIHQDPLTTFYEAMCVGLNDDHCYNNTINHNPDDDFQQFPQGNNSSQDYQNETFNQTAGGVVIRSSRSLGSRSKRTSLSVQRERTKRLKMQDLMEYFDIRMEQAAKMLNVCPTVVKKLCRRNGIERWPFRKVRSLKKNIAKKTELLNSSGGEGKKRLQADILMMEQELAQIYETIY